MRKARQAARSGLAAGLVPSRCRGHCRVARECQAAGSRFAAIGSSCVAKSRGSRFADSGYGLLYARDEDVGFALGADFAVDSVHMHLVFEDTEDGDCGVGRRQGGDFLDALAFFTRCAAKTEARSKRTSTALVSIVCTRAFASISSSPCQPSARQVEFPCAVSASALSDPLEASVADR